MNIRNIDINLMNPAKYNPRKNLKPTDKQYQHIKNSIETFGYIDPVIWNEKTGNIVGGHQRFKILKDRGESEVECVVVDFDETTEKAANAALNKAVGEWDDDLLDVLLKDLNDVGFDMEPFGFDPFEPEIIEDDDFEVELPVEPVSKIGQIYQLGKHRLMVGDSTIPENIDKLMAGDVADLCVTDPPYNVNYKGKTKDAMTIMNDNMAKESFYSFLLAAYQQIIKSLKPGGVIYVFHADTEGVNFRTALIDAGFKLSECLIWVKNALVLGHSDYQWQHEPILYGWKEGASHYIINDRTLTTVLEQKKESNKLHPTMKPLDLLSRLILNSSKENEIVLDSFGGSGSTLIACEQTKRVCRMMELDPRYADVIIKRYEDYTGGKAVMI